MSEGVRRFCAMIVEATIDPSDRGGSLVGRRSRCQLGARLRSSRGRMHSRGDHDGRHTRQHHAGSC